MPFPPEVYLIGAQKAGTTFLANLLAQHPDICLADPKEPHYFTLNRSKGLEWYERLFAAPQARYLLDASPSYSAAPLRRFGDERKGSGRYCGVPERIARLSPDARLVYLLRDPIRRTYSSYLHNVRAGHERMGFREAIERNSFYLRASHYYDQLAAFLEHFPRRSISILFFEELVEAPQEVAARVFGFLDIRTDVDVAAEVGRNASFVYRPAVASLNRSLSRWGGLGRALGPMRRAFPERLVTRLSGAIARKAPKLKEEDRRYLVDYFEPENAKLEQELGLRLPGWERSALSNVDTSNPRQG